MYHPEPNDDDTITEGQRVELMAEASRMETTRCDLAPHRELSALQGILLGAVIGLGAWASLAGLAYLLFF